MKIALLAPPYLSVPPVGYGGTERIVSDLTEGLVDRGHEVTLFASGDSKTAAHLFSTFPKAIGNSGLAKTQPLLPMMQYIDCFSRASEFDLIHNHAQYYAMFLAELVATPVVHTIHGSFYTSEVPEEKRQVLRRFKKHHFISISHNQREGLPELNWAGTVYNGINLSDYKFNSNHGDYLLWFGRVTPKKGAVEAVEVAKRVGIRLKMVTTIDPIDRPFYEEKVAPLLKNADVEFITEIKDQEAKSDLYAGALATLYPISWHEPFGLVMVESMAAGTPVIATKWGSVAEIVKDGETGYVVETIEQMVEAVKKVQTISRTACRKRVEENYSIGKMVDGYEEVYKKIINHNNQITNHK